jgi:hypothetical protein
MCGKWWKEKSKEEQQILPEMKSVIKLLIKIFSIHKTN